MTLSIRQAGLCNIGRMRAENQDRWTSDPAGGLFIVADGIGGGPAGGLAAQVVVDTLPGLVRKRINGLTDGSASEALASVAGSLAELSDRLLHESLGKPGLSGMGSTVVMALVRDGQAVVGHLGDSRAYLLREGKLRQLTKDHSLIQLLIETGNLDPRDAETHPARGQLTRFVGMTEEPLPEVSSMEVQAHDRLLLCSDGLSGMLSDEVMTRILARHEEPEVACRQLIDAANSAGGKDNITALVLEFGETTSE